MYANRLCQKLNSEIQRLKADSFSALLARLKACPDTNPIAPKVATD